MKVKGVKKPENPSVMFWCRATPEMAQRVDAIAQQEDRPRSWVIRQLLVKALESQREKATA